MPKKPLLLAACAGILFSDPTTAEPVSVAINPSATQGVWEGWGASLAWWAAVFGDREDLADGFFTLKDVTIGDETLPGLGMNIVRYNAGASAWRKIGEREMQVSKIILRYRQMEGFWLDDRSSDPESDSWDWTVDAKQRQMMSLAKDRGVTHFELFSNSPMWWMTVNDNPSGGPKPTDENLSRDQERNFAIYLATIARRSADEWGIPFTTVSPFNEPMSHWWFADCKQEGCRIYPEAQARVIALVREELDKRDLKDLPISASEETFYDHAIQTWESFDEKTRSLVDQVNVHGYQGAEGDRVKLHQLIREETDKILWNSEAGDVDGSGITMASNLHLDLRYLKPTAWCYWQPIDGGGWGLLPADMVGGRLQRSNPKWHVLAHYSRHLRPGTTILTTGENSVVGAYDSTSSTLTLVLLNSTAQEKAWEIDLSRFTGTDIETRAWITETAGDARYQQLQPEYTEGPLKINLPQKSLKTIVLKGLHPSGA